MVHIDATPEGATVLPHAGAPNALATFRDRVYTEFHVAKHLAESTTVAEEALPAKPPDLKAATGVRSALG